MSLFTTIGDAFGLGSDVAAAVQTPADQALLANIPAWKAQALKGDTVAYANLQCVAGNTNYGACVASGYVQGVAQAAVQEIDSTTKLAQGLGAGSSTLAALGNAIAPASFWQSFASTLGVSLASVQLLALITVGFVIYLVVRKK